MVKLANGWINWFPACICVCERESMCRYSQVKRSVFFITSLTDNCILLIKQPSTVVISFKYVCLSHCDVPLSHIWHHDLLPLVSCKASWACLHVRKCVYISPITSWKIIRKIRKIYYAKIKLLHSSFCFPDPPLVSLSDESVFV